ncbi:unnamed protein product [Ostreobium quekettii]|uniref:HRDC domain-containing protein n=1 Tax=Ostreobium quekettii TaxID=121088 RepID=A0A8S1J0V6_9CHLO|nr:unnamed protein product [Ostreobium quekettii]
METIKNLLAKLEVHRFPNKCTDNLRAEALSTASQSAAWLASLVDDLLDRGNKALEAHRTGTKRGPKCPATEVGPMGQAGGQLGNVSLAPQWVEGGRANKRQRPGSLWGSDKKPQKGFAIPVDNSNEPYKPRLDHLAGLLTGYPPETFDNSQPDALLAKIGIRDCQGLYPHPFQAELNALKYIPSQLAKGTCREPEAIESTPFLYVDSQEGLEKLVEHLHGQEEVAVDLEANLFRSFQGLTCLLQMSTRTRDFIVDTLAVKDEIGPALAPMFADPQVVKVMHGGGNDILWLQHDLGIYVVNLFDTHQACKVGGHLRGGLAYLLEQYCSIKADKRLQLADWRIRPLSKEMLHYAQCDTHYLLYIYDKLRHQLIDQGEEVPEKFQVDLRDGSPTGALGTVLERSRILCLQRYEKPLLNEFSYLSILKREAEGLNEVQEMVAAALYAWRDATARDLDESAGFVLSKKVLVKLAVALPDNVKQVQKHLKKGSQGFGDAIFNVITNARQRFMLGRLQAASPGTPGALASVSLDLPPAAPATTLEPKPVCIKAASGQSAFQRMLGATNLTATDGSDVKMHIAEPSLCESAIQTADIDMNANLSLMGVDAVADSHCPCSADVTTASQLPSNAGGLKDGMEDVQQLAGCGPATGLRAREVKPIVLQGRPCSMQGDIEDKGLTAAEMIKASFSLPFMVATNVGNDGDVEGQGEEGGRVGNGMDVDLGESVEPTETAIAGGGCRNPGCG